jgi:tartrate dehydrogenase/decarboxylase/D-malate dehydrogenase
MMMEHLEQSEAAAHIMKAIEIVLKEGIAHTPDMGGKANTKECGDAVIDVLKDLLYP